MLVCFFLQQLHAQEQNPSQFFIDVSNANFPVLFNHLKLGTHTNAKGESFDANSLYFLKNGKLWYPVMGEFHFSRFPKEQWEESILKMKACGINVIATYIFWIYHEEEKGIWNWQSNNDLRTFAELCAKHNLFLFVRIGPWCHGEVRNGGLPDWLLKETKIRSNDSAYLSCVKRFYQEIHQQLKGLYFKDGGTIIGTQIENEFRFNNAKGLNHILTLKKMAIEVGIDVPYYSATAWQGADIKQAELLPVWGAYPEAPWDKKTTQLALSENYLFDSLKSDKSIGNDLLGNTKDSTNYKGYRYPYATAEMGAGIQVTYHRRPVILPEDVLGLALTKMGSGANLMGYYMFHGGINAIGKLSTFQESKATKYPNDYPVISYDFQSPLGQWGDIKPSYAYFKLFHSFLKNFGNELTTYHTYFPAAKPKGKADSSSLRWAVRSNGNKGFIIINQFQRQLKMANVANVQFAVKLDDGSILNVPEKPVTIAKNTQLILPFNLSLNGVKLVYSTTQPVTVFQNGKEQIFIFYADENIASEYVLAVDGIKKVSSNNAVVENRKSSYKISNIHAGLNEGIIVQLNNGGSIRIITLTHEQALQSWQLTANGKEQFIVSDAELISDGKSVQLQSTGKSEVKFTVFGNHPTLKFVNAKTTVKSQSDLFISYQINFQSKEIPINFSLNKELIEASAKLIFDTAKTTTTFYPLYDTKLKPIAGATYWNVYIPSNTLNGLSNAFLKVDYEGDTQAVYLNDSLIVDDFYMGLPNVISLKSFPKLVGKQLTILVTPLQRNSKIYFESNIANKLFGNKINAVKSIVLIPQYFTKITGL